MSEKKFATKEAIITLALISTLIAGYLEVNESIVSLVPDFIRNGVEDLLSRDLANHDIAENMEVLQTIQTCRELMSEPSADACIVKQIVNGNEYWVGLVDKTGFDQARRVTLVGKDEKGAVGEYDIKIQDDGTIISLVKPKALNSLEYLVLDNAYGSEPVFLDLFSQAKIESVNYVDAFKLFEHHYVIPPPRIYVDPPTSW